jgi:hypothetical protein
MFSFSSPHITIGTRGIWPFDFWPLPFGLRPFHWYYSLDEKSYQVHKIIMGTTGQGKSTLVEKMITDLILQGVAVSVIDPHSDLVHNTLRHVFEAGYFKRNDAHQKLWYVDLSRRDRILPWNVLKQTNGKGEPVPLDVIAGNMKDVVKRAFPALSGGAAPVFENILQFSAVALAANNLPLMAIELLLTNKPFRQRLLANCPHFPTVSFFQNRFEKWDKKKQAEDVESTLNKMSIISLSEPLMNSFSQQENCLDFRRIIDEGISVLYNLGDLNMDAKRLAGCFLNSGYEQAALSRTDIPVSRRLEHQLFIDEFHRTANQESLSTTLSEARKYKLYLNLIHQTFDQLSPELKSAVQNVWITIYFGLGYDDAFLAAPRIGHANPYHTKHEPRGLKGHELTVEQNPAYFTQQEEYEAWTRKLENLWDREAYIKRKRKVPRLLQFFMKPHKTTKIRTIKVPSQTCRNEDLQQIKDLYASWLMKPKVASDATRETGAHWHDSTPPLSPVLSLRHSF